MLRIFALLACTLGSTTLTADALANCRGQIEGPLPNQIGTVMIFSSRDGGPKHPSLPSEFWAVTGRYDTGPSHVYPVRFSESIAETVDTWDWHNLSFSPPVLTVIIDAEFDGLYLWLTVKELLLDESQIEAAYDRFPEARRRCPSLFSGK